MTRFVCAALKAEDIFVTEASSGAQALQLWAAEPSDLVLQNLMLPDMDGFELIPRLRELPGGAIVPVLALSGLLTGLEESRISAVGFSDIILKPIEVSRLRQVVRAHLPQVQSPAARFGEGRRILIVDDDPTQAKLVAYRLSRLGFQTSTAADGREALCMARAERPAAIVSDIMMPGLDGFGLCAEVRRDPGLGRIPLVLMTNSYVDDADRDLARTAGADEFVVRTPSMLEVIEALRSSLARHTGVRSSVSKCATDIETVWARRVMSQLERQVSINTGIARRCSMLSAELAILSGISDALAGHHDIQAALTDVLGACVDAAGFSLGALRLFQSEPASMLKFGHWAGWSEAQIEALLNRAEHALGHSGQSLVVATPAGMRDLSPLFEQSLLTNAVVVPVVRGEVSLGTLLMGSKASPLHQEDRLAFLQGVATQIAQALTLTRAFAERQASEQKAKEQADVLRSVLETVAEGVVVTGAGGEFLLWNPAAEAILGTGSAHVPARDWPERFGLSFNDTITPVPAEQVPLVRALAGQVVDDGEPFFLNGGSGQGKFVTINARPLKGNQAVVGAVAVLRDVTEEKSTQTQLLVADRLASLGMLAAGVAHEINNPLAAVIANLDLAGESLATLSNRVNSSLELEDVSHLLREARDAGGRVQRIVRDLRVFSRAEADTSAPVDIHDVLESVLRMADNEIRHRATVVRDYGEVSPVLGSESRLSQVFLNLVMNAAQALTDGRADDNEIRISTRMDERGRVVVTVADTGEGIDPESMKRLFVPFFTTKRVGIGTGLGLSICHRLITAAGGEITVDNQPGGGAAFHVALRPAPRAARTAPRNSLVRTSAPSHRRGRILMVDDDSCILSFLLRTLEKNHDCTAVSMASDALSRVIGGERFDVILCDLMMPVMNGMELYTELQRSAPEQSHKLVFLTGGAFTAELQAFLATVPNQCIEKPFDIGELREAVRARLPAADTVVLDVSLTALGPEALDSPLTADPTTREVRSRAN